VEKGNELKTILRLELPTLQALTPGSLIEFALLDRQHTVLRTGEMSLSEIAGAVPGYRVEAILHPGDTIVTTVTVPPLPPHRMGAAVAGAVEPMLLGEIETLAVAHGARHADGTVAVAWGPREHLARALAVLADVGLSADALLPAPLALAQTENGWTAAVRDGYLIVRSGPESGYCWAIDTVTPQQDGAEPAAAALLLAMEPALPAAVAWVPPVPIGWIAPEAVESRTLPAEARWSGVAPSWSLALADLQPRHAGRSRWRKPLIWTAAAAAVWLLGLNVHAWQLSREEQALRQRMVAQVKAAFPDLPVIVDPLKQAEQRRDALRTADGKFGSSDFLPMSLAAADALPQAASNLTAVSYADAELRLKLVDDGIGMVGAAAVTGSTPGAGAPPRRLSLQRTPPPPTGRNAPTAQTAGIDPAVLQRAQALGLNVDRVEGMWRFRLASAGSNDAGGAGVTVRGGVAR